jgi:hypothetical protein
MAMLPCYPELFVSVTYNYFCHVTLLPKTISNVTLKYFYIVTLLPEISLMLPEIRKAPNNRDLLSNMFI